MTLFISSLLRVMMFSLVVGVLFVKPSYAAEQGSAASLDDGAMIDESMDDEGVEDIDASMPDNERFKKSVNNDTKTTASEKATKVAPNINLKEVAPTQALIEEDKTVEPAASPTPLVLLPTDELTAKPVNESITLFKTEVLPNTSTRLAWSSGIQIAGLAQPIRADMHIEDIARFPRGFDGIAVVHSVGNPGMLRSADVGAGIVAVTLEVGESLRIQEDEIKAGVKNLNSLMEKQKMILRFFVWGQPETVYYNSYWVRAEHGGILFSQVELGDSVKQGDILGTVSDPIINT